MIHTLAKTYDLNGNILKNAIVETFNHRKTTLDNIAAFNEDFVNNSINIQRWNSFNKQKKVSNIMSLKETIDFIKELFMPIVDAIKNKKCFNYIWSKDEKKWNKADDSAKS